MEKWRPCEVRSRVGLHTRQRTDPPPPIRCPFTSISSSLSACSPVQYSKTYRRTYSLRQPDANCCEPLQSSAYIQLNRPDHQSEPIARLATHEITAHSDRRPKTEDRRRDDCSKQHHHHYGKHLSGPRKHNFRDAGLCEPPLRRAQVFRLQSDV